MEELRQLLGVDTFPCDTDRVGPWVETWNLYREINHLAQIGHYDPDLHRRLHDRVRDLHKILTLLARLGYTLSEPHHGNNLRVLNNEVSIGFHASPQGALYLKNQLPAMIRLAAHYPRRVEKVRRKYEKLTAGIAVCLPAPIVEDLDEL